jgi:hypothetical protein
VLAIKTLKKPDQSTNAKFIFVTKRSEEFNGKLSITKRRLQKLMIAH